MADKYTNTQTSKGDNVSAGSGQTGTGRLDAGRTYTGVIIETFHGDNLYSVSIDGQNSVIKCKWAAGIFAPLVGIRTNYLPPVGSRVVVLKSPGEPSWIISCVPSEPYDADNGASRTMIGHDVASEPYAPKFDGVSLSTVKPNDLLEGEYEIANTFGVAIQMLTTLISVKGSERAKIEAFLLNDMVRIVSDAFKHVTCFGDYQIYNDGRLNCKWDGTSYDHEAWGLEKPTDEKFSLNNRKVSIPDTTEANIIETGRWRFSHFVGFLGNFIHTFVTDPTTTLSSIAENAFRSGKARVHINNDGTILMQSVADIALERVCRIVMPVEKKRPDDPEGVKADQFDQLDKSYLKIWDYGQNMSNAHHTAYQLRQYARWLSCFHSYARFLQMDKEWDIPKETDIPDPSWFNKEQDVADANNGKPEWYDVYATIRIMRDGSIVLFDAYGSAISMVAGNVQICSSRHIELDAAGDIRMSAGQNIYIKARRNIEITSIVGGLTLKARAWWKALCEWGTVWIKSDAVDPALTTPPSPDDPEQDPNPEVHGAAIFLDASAGQTLIQSERRATVSVVGQSSTSDITNSDHSVVLQSAYQDVRSLAARHSITKVLGLNESKVIIDALLGNSVIVNCLNFLVNARLLFDVNSKFTLKNSILHMEELRSKRAAFSDIVTGPARQGFDTSNRYDPHNGHIGKYDEANTPIEVGGNTEARDSYQTTSVLEPEVHISTERPKGPSWSFNEETKTFTYASGSIEEVFQSLAQQQLELNNDTANYAEWDWNVDNKLKQADRTNPTSLPYPGKEAQEKVFDGGVTLSAPLDEEYKDQSPDKAKDLKDKNIVKRFIKYP